MADEETGPAAVEPPHDPPGEPEARSGDESPEEDAGGRPARRRWLGVTAGAVAVAVIAGAMYGVQSLGGDSGADADAGGSAPPLTLDAPLAPGGPGGAAATEDAAGGGWYGPFGWQTLSAEGPLPEGPESAHQYVFDGGDGAGRADVTELAAALGLDGEVSGASGSWTVPGTDPDVPMLTVTGQAPASWSFGRLTADIAVGGPLPDATDTSPQLPVDNGTPVAPEAALATAEPVLDALGLSDAAVDASRTLGGTRVVRAVPVLDGLPVHGLETEIHVGPEGELVTGFGSLAEPVADVEREVTLSAPQALRAHNDGVAAREVTGELPLCAQEGPAEPAEPAEPEDGGAGVGCAHPNPADAPEPVAVTAEFGLALRSSEGEPVLVPSWLFHVTGTAENGGGNTLSHPAIDHAVADADPGDPPGSGGGDSFEGDPGQAGPAGPGSGDSSEPGGGISAYEADGRSLTVHFWGGVCDDYTATAEESGDDITVTLTASNPDPERACVMVAEEMTAEVRLDRPVAGRTVVDTGGGEIPVR